MRTPSRRELNRAERRAAIVATARGAFLQNGYGNTTMSMIAEAVGGSKATLWAYFHSKEELFGAVVDGLIESFEAELQETLLPGRDIEKTLSEFCDRFLIKLMGPQSIGLYRLVIGEGERFPAIGKLFYERGPRRMIDRLAGYLEEEQDRGAVRPCDSSMAAMQLIGLCQVFDIAFILEPTRDGSAKARRRHAEAAAAMFLRAYGMGAEQP